MGDIATSDLSSRTGKQSHRSKQQNCGDDHHVNSVLVRRGDHHPGKGPNSSPPTIAGYAADPAQARRNERLDAGGVEGDEEQILGLESERLPV
jgi:hypothetical protein